MRKETILIADDSEINRTILCSLFKGEYTLLEAENGEEAMELLQEHSSTITAVLLDLVMPVKSGYQVLEEMQGLDLLYHVPVVVITADNSADSHVRVFDLGASDIITKPFDPNVVKSRVKNIIELGRYRQRLETMVAEQSARAQKSNAAVIDMLSSVIEHRSLESGQHIRRIRLFTQILLEDVSKNYQEYDLDDKKIQIIADASSMHDIGKIAIPDSILNKPGRLTPEEFEIMKTHTTRGCEILAGLDQIQDQAYLQYAYNICRYHHERWDGRGYPDGLKENNIPICAQVVAIADCYDALTTDRVYKKAIPPSQAFNMILNGECGVFSPRLLECFKNVRDPFAQLSQEYADGRPAQPILESKEFTTLEGPSALRIGANTLEQSQLKYFTLLRYMDATVLEADLSTGVYHMVYLGDQDFAALKSGENFVDAINCFSNASIHPEERDSTLQMLEEDISGLFDKGLARRDRRFRVFDQRRGCYVWSLTSLLRINLENPRQRKCLLIWRKSDEVIRNPSPQANAIDLSGPILDRILNGVQKCRNDRHFTLLQLNRGLIDMLGYSREEIAQRFDNRYMELVYPPDREKLVHELVDQSNQGKTANLEYRLVAKDGSLVCVSDRCLLTREGDEEVLYCILLDITRSRRAEEALRLSLERHNIIMNQTNDIIFEWNIVTDELYLSSNWEKQFGYTAIQDNVRAKLPYTARINPADMPTFLHLMDVIAAGAPYKEVELRIANVKGQFRWVRIRATCQYDEDQKPVKAVGVILDIDSQKKAAAELEDRATRDALTKLWNRSFAQERVEARLRSCQPGELVALMVLDVDNFKQINDGYGHMFGDAVLVELSTKLTGLFRQEDTIARIGGDEFMIFIPELQTQDLARQRGQAVLDTLRETLRDSLGELGVSCSIGLAFSADEPRTFETLFNQADRALYRAKALGKNRMVCYQETMEDGPIGIPAGHPAAARTKIDSNHSLRWDLSLLITAVFDILYNAQDLDQGIQNILAMIGERFSVSRTYIIEVAPDRETYRPTYEWHVDESAARYKQINSCYQKAEGGNYMENFNDKGIFYCHNVQALPQWHRQLLEQHNTVSLLQFAIREGDTLYGVVGLDDCSLRRLWTEEQVETLTFVGKMLGIFLRKKRTQEALSVSLGNLRSLLDHQEVWLYVLDPETYQVRFANKKTMGSFPDCDSGKPCYQVFHHRDSPCENCGLRVAREQGHSSVEIYNPTLDLWVVADAAMVNWNDQPACLISCRDITNYIKKPRPPLETP